MKKIINLFFVCISILTTISAYAQTPTVPAGYSVRQVASSGLLAGQLLDGIVADPISGNVYVAGVSSTSSSNFNLYKITPAGVVSFIRNYAFAHNEVVKMAFNVNDGHIYTLDGNSGSIYKINPTTGTSSIYASNIGNGRYGLNFDPAGNLIIGFESMFDFYKVTPAGKVNMGHVSASVPNGNHGDAFGIQPNGNYVVYVDCGGQNNYAINTAGHTEGTDYPTLEWTSPTNIFSSLMPGGCGYSNGAIDPNTGDVYSSISNFGSGNTKILFTAENGGPTTAFVNDGSAIMDLCFGKESNKGNCNSLYFIDRNLNTVFEVPMNNCCTPSPTATTVSGGGTFCGNATITASGGTGGVIYFQGNSNGTSTADSATSKVITSSGTYYFRAQIPGGCWGKAGSVIVNIKPTPTAPIISPAGNIEYCEGNSTTTTLSIPSIPFSPVTTYNIPLANLVNVPNSCGGGSQYGSGQVGFTWNDAGNGLVANVQIKFSVGVECNVGAHTTSFNSLASNGFNTTTGWCSCGAPSTPQIFTVNFSPTNYNVGGANTFLMSANTFGFFPAAALGGNYAQVIVTYAAPAAVWSPGGQTTSSITVSPVSTSTYTVSVTGGNGCSSQSEKTVTVKVCNQAPVAVCKNISLSTDNDCTASANAIDFDGGSTDPDGDSLIFSVSPAGPFAIGVTNVAITVTDPHGLSSICTATVTVQDNVAPVALTQNITVQLGAIGNASISPADVNNGSTDACGIASLNVSQNNFTCANVGDNIVTLTVTDNNGNVSTETATVTIQDKIAPVVVCRNITVQLNATGQATITANDVNNGSNDVCGIASVTIDKSTFDCSNLGANIITLTVTDLSGNISSCQATITLEDKVAPVALCKNVTVHLDANGQAIISATDVNNGSNDACGIASLSVNPSSFNCSKTGNNNVVLTVTDVNGNSSSCTAVVTVKDVTAPVIVCQSDITVGSSTTSCSAKVAFNLPQVSDNCSGGSNSNPIVNGSFESGNYNGWSLSSTSGTCGLFAIGNAGQTISNGQIIFDYANNMNEQVISPGFLFTPAPSDGTKMGVFLQRCGSTHSLYQNVTLPSGTISLCLDLGYRNHAVGFSPSQFIAIELRNPSTNAIITTLFKTTPGSPAIRPFSNMCFDISAYAGQSVKIQIIDASIYSSQLDVFFDNIKIVGGTSLVQTAGLPSLSQFPIGTTTNTFVATDSYGNSSTCSFNVTVNDNVAPIALTKNITVQLNATGEASITATQINNGSSDACGIASLSVSPNSFTCANVGNNTVTLTVTDNNGNVSTETATVLVQDNVAPVALTQNITVSLDAAGNGSITATQVNNGSSDACGIASLSVSPNSFTCANVGNNTVTLTVTDNNGNVSTETATVLVQDNVAPAALTQNITVSLDAAGNASITATQVNNGSSDACGIASLSVSPNSFTCANVGNNTVTLTVTDNNGNVSTETATVLVQDNVAPVALTQNITVSLDVTGNGSITATQVDNGSSDACGIASLSVSPNSFTCANVGNNTVTLTVTDNNGNVSTETATVLVQDNVAPVALCKSITVQLDANGEASITAADINNGSNDACGIASVIIDQSNFTCSNVGTNVVTLTVTDVNGNVSTCVSTVTIEDKIVPIISCPANISVQAQRNDCSPVVTWSALEITDNCTFTVNSNYQSGDHFPVGTTTVNYSVIDASGNTASCSFDVTVTSDPLVASVLAKTYFGGHNISCKGKNDGEVAVTVNGGCLPYTYSWSTTPAQTGAVASGLTSGTYTVIITDANGSTTSLVTTLTEPNQLVVEAGSNQTVYFGYAPKACAALNGTVTGGVASYTYSWSNGASSASTNVCPNVTTSYDFTVTDLNGCVANDIVTVCAIDVRCEKGGNSILKGQGNKVMICHKSGNGKTQTLCIDASSIADHLAHGDQLGECGVNLACFTPAGREMEESDNAVIENIGNNMNVLAYPNPFNTTTTISFNSTQDDRVSIKVYNIEGAEVSNLFEGNLKAGDVKDVIFDGTSLPNGIYFYKVMTNGGKMIVNKLIINK
ncbi:MAG: HYR domain-containing protein [Bacteroidia bacterium]|nr:HYR domain-containing protein [Bacteroidia bacterium]